MFSLPQNFALTLQKLAEISRNKQKKIRKPYE